MSNPTTFVAITWQTRNERHAGIARTSCNDYGLSAITKTVFIGRVRKQDLEVLITKLSKLFINKTELLRTIRLCEECFHKALIPEPLKHKLANPQPFKIF